MAKKKAKTESIKKKSSVKAVEAPKQPEPAKKMSMVLPMVLLAFVLFTIIEIYFVTTTSIRQSKKPGYVNSWAITYKGYTTAGEYGDYLYANDNGRGDVYKTDKNNGNFVKMLSFPEGTYCVVADSKGVIYVLTKKNEVVVIDGTTYKTLKTVKITDVEVANWIEVDSNDNFFLLSAKNGNIVKYGPDFAKVAAFGGQGSDKPNVNPGSKLFIGPNNRVYVLNAIRSSVEMEVKIFDNDGKYMTSWPIKKIKTFDGMTNLAIAPDGNVYINSYKESRIYVYASTGKYLGNFDADKDSKFQIVNGAVLIVGGKNGLLYIFSSKLAVLKPITY